MTDRHNDVMNLTPAQVRELLDLNTLHTEVRDIRAIHDARFPDVTITEREYQELTFCRDVLVALAEHHPWAGVEDYLFTARKALQVFGLYNNFKSSRWGGGKYHKSDKPTPNRNSLERWSKISGRS